MKVIRLTVSAGTDLNNKEVTRAVSLLKERGIKAEVATPNDQGHGRILVDENHGGAATMILRSLGFTATEDFQGTTSYN
jgi:hypothetical protein